jgi:hypothetical protein
MAEDRHSGLLGAAYDAKGPEEVAALYDRWSDSYEGEMARAGYRSRCWTPERAPG